MRKTRVAINGFGRIGRAFLRLSWNHPELEIVAINDLGNEDNLAYLLKYDSVYGQAPFDIKNREGALTIAGKDIVFVQEKDPTALPWGELAIDVVVESTGLFTSFDKAKVHLDAGAKRVVITAPAKGDAVPGIESATVLMGINDEKLKTCKITSNASCTTNASSPVIQIIHETLGVEKAILSTTHAYTASQRIVDSPNEKDFREGRAGAANIIPSSTGAAIAVAKAIPDLEGKFDGISLRVPVPVGSIADITMLTKKSTSKEEVNDILKKASLLARWEGVFTVAEEPLVSSDIVGNTHAAIAQLDMTRVVDGNLIKVLSWYDNEMGYTNTLVKHVVKLGSHI